MHKATKLAAPVVKMIGKSYLNAWREAKRTKQAQAVLIETELQFWIMR